MLYNINEEILELNQLLKEHDENYKRYAMHLGISDSSFWILYALCESDELLTQNDLCTLWYFPKQTVNSSIKALEKSGYIRLVPIPSSRNSKAVTLTPQGIEYCQKNIVSFMKAEDDAFLTLSKEERDLFIKIYRRQIVSIKAATEVLMKGDLND